VLSFRQGSLFTGPHEQGYRLARRRKWVNNQDARSQMVRFSGLNMANKLIVKRQERMRAGGTVASKREPRLRKVYASPCKRFLSGQRACSADAHVTGTGELRLPCTTRTCFGRRAAGWGAGWGCFVVRAVCGVWCAVADRQCHRRLDAVRAGRKILWFGQPNKAAMRGPHASKTISSFACTSTFPVADQMPAIGRCELHAVPTS
jgi:hypothetical protein